MKLEEIISNEEINGVWGNANFGSIAKREVIRNTLLKCASSYYSGHTATCIVRELGLVKSTNWELTKKGKQYLFEAYSNGISI